MTPPNPGLLSAPVERIASLEAKVDHILTFTEEHPPDEMVRFRELWGALDGLRVEVVALRSDLMLAKGAFRGAATLAGVGAVAIGALWAVIQAVIPHLPSK
jgi:hypothetical protein